MKEQKKNTIAPPSSSPKEEGEAHNHFAQVPADDARADVHGDHALTHIREDHAREEDGHANDVLVGDATADDVPKEDVSINDVRANDAPTHIREDNALVEGAIDDDDDDEDEAMAVDPEPLLQTSRIRDLNDRFRQSFIGGSVMLTSGIINLGARLQNKIITAIRAFTAFDRGNDPYGEHDFGCVTIEDIKVFWKIDYYDPTMTCGANDPANPQTTRRVLTIMLASEY